MFGLSTALFLACENIRFSSLFAVPSGEERGETDVFAGYSFSSSYNSVPFESPLQCGSVQWWIQGRGPGGGQVPTPYFFSETGPEGPKKFILETGAPPTPLSQGLDDRPPSPYLMVWICHCSLQCLGADSRVLCI